MCTIHPREQSQLFIAYKQIYQLRTRERLPFSLNVGETALTFGCQFFNPGSHSNCLTSVAIKDPLINVADLSITIETAVKNITAFQ